MTDLTDAWVVRSDQLNGDDLIGKTITIKITKVVKKESGEQNVHIHYEGDNGKPWKPCLTMGKVLKQAWGTNGNDYLGRYITLYQDPKVKFGGLDVGGIRISHMSHIPAKLIVVANESKGRKKAWTVLPLEIPTANPPAQPPIITPEEIAILKLEGNEIADKGMDALKEWWKSIGGAKQKALGSEFLDELKKLATPTAE